MSNIEFNEGYNFIAFQMRLHKFIINLAENVVSLNESKLSNLIKSNKLTSKDLIIIKKGLEDVKSKYKDKLESLSDLDLLLNFDKNYDMISLFKLDDVSFIRELDEFLRSYSKFIELASNHLSSDRSMRIDSYKKLNANNAKTNVDLIDYVFGIKHDINKFHDLVAAFNTLVSFIQDSFKVLPESAVNDAIEGKFGSIIYATVKQDLGRLISGQYTVKDDFKLIPIVMLESGVFELNINR